MNSYPVKVMHFGGITFIVKTTRVERNWHRHRMGTAVLCMTGGPEGIRYGLDCPMGFVW